MLIIIANYITSIILMTTINLIFIICGLLSFNIFTYIFIKNKYHSTIEISNQMIKNINSTLEAKIQEIQNLKNENLKQNELNELIAKLETINAFNNKELQNINDSLNDEKHKAIEIEKLYNNARCTISSMESEISVIKENFKLVNESLLSQFKNIATEITNQNTIKFNQESNEKLNTLINPLTTKLQDFQKTVQDCFNIEAKEKFSLKESINNILHSNNQIKYEASKLTNALKSNNMILGHWGEMILENILISSGLRANFDYELQEKSASNTTRPDAIIKLPGEKRIIIDAKTSYFDAELFNDLVNEDDKNKYLKDFVKKIRNQIDNLASKEYHYNAGGETPELSLMFIPVESWYNAAIQFDKNLYEYGWSKNVVLISAPILFVILKTIAYVWKGENQEKNALKIAEYAGGLYDSFVDLMNNLMDIGKSIKLLCKNYDAALSKLSNGRGNILIRLEYIKTLGIKHKKNLEKNGIIEIQESIKNLSTEIISEIVDSNSEKEIIFSE